MKTGSTVRLIQPVIVGVVKARRLRPTDDEMEVLVEWKEGDNLVQRWFDADQWEELAPPPAGTPDEGEAQHDQRQVFALKIQRAIAEAMKVDEKQRGLAVGAAVAMLRADAAGAAKPEGEQQ